jgi:hypothetical protein
MANTRARLIAEAFDTPLFEDQVKCISPYKDYSTCRSEEHEHEIGRCLGAGPPPDKRNHPTDVGRWVFNQLESKGYGICNRDEVRDLRRSGLALQDRVSELTQMIQDLKLAALAKQNAGQRLPSTLPSLSSGSFGAASKIPCSTREDPAKAYNRNFRSPAHTRDDCQLYDIVFVDVLDVLADEAIETLIRINSISRPHASALIDRGVSGSERLGYSARIMQNAQRHVVDECARLLRLAGIKANVTTALSSM